MENVLNECLRTQQVEKSTLLGQLHTYLPQLVARFYEALPFPALSFAPEQGRRRLARIATKMVSPYVIGSTWTAVGSGRQYGCSPR